MNPQISTASLAGFLPVLPKAGLKIRSSFAQQLSCSCERFQRSEIIKAPGEKVLARASTFTSLAFDTLSSLPTRQDLQRQGCFRINRDSPICHWGTRLSVNLQTPERQAFTQRLLSIVVASINATLALDLTHVNVNNRTSSFAKHNLRSTSPERSAKLQHCSFVSLINSGITSISSTRYFRDATPPFSPISQTLPQTRTVFIVGGHLIWPLLRLRNLIVNTFKRALLSTAALILILHQSHSFNSFLVQPLRPHCHHQQVRTTSSGS